MTMGPVMLDLVGTTLSERDQARLRHPGVGGLILFSRNIENPFQVRELLRSVRALRPELIIAVDQEGGRVQRIREGATLMPPLAILGEWYDTDPLAALGAARDWGWLMAAEMLALGFDISFAPVLDLNYQRSQVIGNRAFHRQASIIVELAGAYIAGMNSAGMAATGKHFPGHGWVVADSHVDMPIDDRAQIDIEAEDMVPFVHLAQQLDGIMPAHVIYSQIDPMPAGFSAYWLQQVLRQRLAYSGVVFSDDLSMEGASLVGGYWQRAQAALDAGCDMVLACNNPAGADEILDALEQQPYWPQQERLTRMLARQQPVWEELQQDSRYLAIRKSMSSIREVR